MNRFKLHRRRQAPDASDAGSGRPPAVLDAEAINRLRQLDPDGSRGFMGQLLRTFDASLVRHLASLRAAQAQADLKSAGDVAHTLKSSSASVGALDFAQACAVVERGARLGDTAVLQAPLEGLLDEGERVLAAVRAMLAS